MVILTTVQVTSFVSSSLTQARSDIRYFYYWFLDLDEEDLQTGEDYPRFLNVFDIDTLNETLREGFDVHFS